MWIKIKDFFIDKIFFIGKFLLCVCMIFLCLYVLKGKISWGFLGRLFSEDRGKKNIKKLEKAGKEIKKTRTRLQGLKNEITEFIENNGKLPMLDSNGDPIDPTS